MVEVLRECYFCAILAILISVLAKWSSIADSHKFETESGVNVFTYR